MQNKKVQTWVYIYINLMYYTKTSLNIKKYSRNATRAKALVLYYFSQWIDSLYHKH